MTRAQTVLSVVAASMMLVASARADFFLHNVLDLSDSNFFASPLFDNDSPLGTNASAVTYDGSSLWLAGFNGGTSVPGTSGITKISNPWSSPSAATLASSVLTTSGSRGYSGLAYDNVNDQVLAAYDPGAANPNGITAWNTSTDANNWSANARGGSGVGYDPGFGGVDQGAGWTTFGSGRRALQDAGSGADIYTTASGMIINGAGTGTFWRDMDFAPDGDIWLREGNKVISANRTGGNSIDTPSLVVDEPEADFVNGQNLAYLDGLAGGDLVIYNDREVTGTGQLFSFVVKIIDTAGASAGESLLAGNGSPLDPLFAQGSGYFDFEWNAADEELIVLDFNNRLVYRFKTEIVPEPTSLALLTLGGCVLMRRKRV